MMRLVLLTGLVLLILIPVFSFGQFTDEIIFQTEGSSFSPLIQLKAPATVRWTFDDASTSVSLNPTKNYGSSATRTNRLSVDPWSAVKMINIGYDAGDGGSYSMPFVANQNVSKVQNLDLVKDYLEVWCSSYNQLDTLIFDDFVVLDSVECFLSNSIRHVSVSNTPSLTRLCLEDNNLSTLDISECTALADLRGAVNDYSTINFSNSTNEVWHICVRDNPQITNDTLFTHMERFPNISELFIWNDNQKGTFTLTPENISPNMSLMSDGNHYSRLMLKGSLQNERGWAVLRFDHNMLQSVDIEGCDQIHELYFTNNGISSDTIDKILYQLDQLGTSNYHADLRGNWPPTAAGELYKSNLQAKGWTILTEASSEMEVTGNGITIADGDAVPLLTDSTDFGSVDVGEGGITRRFIIQNTGSDVLTFTGTSPFVSIGGAGASNFSVINGLSPSIDEGGSDTVLIHFDATLNGVFNATLSIANNDWNENPYNFSIRATTTIANPDTIIDFSDISDEIIFQTASDSFAPRITLSEPATVLWTFADGTSTSSLTPVKSYPGDASRGNRLKVTPWSALRTINIGYDAGDGGLWSIPHVDNQHVSGVKNLGLVKDYLEVWCSSYNQLDTLIFDDFVVLDTIECFLSQSIRHVSLKNTPSLTRLCLEDNNLSTLDISECTGLMDLRGAVNNYSTINFSTSAEEVWHICVRDNPQITNDSLFAHMEMFPNIAELFIWNDNQGGTFRMSQNNPTRYISIQANGNHYTSLDLRGSLQNESATGEVRFGWNQLKSVNVEGCDQIRILDLPGNNMSQDTVDKVLQQVDAFNTNNGQLGLLGSAIPSLEGMVHKDNLVARGWTVWYETGAEIDLIGNSIPVANNDFTPSLSDNTDLGNCVVGDTIVKNFIVRNSGNISLSGTPAFLRGTDAANFTIIRNVSFPIPPYSSDTLSIAFIPAGKRIFNAEFVINNSDNNEYEYRVAVRGTGILNNSLLISQYDTVTSQLLFLSEGRFFNPLLQLNQAATVLWTFSDGTTSSELNPYKDFSSDSSRMQCLKVSPWNAVSMINIGYDGGDGGWSLPHVPDQRVSYLKNTYLVKDSLKYWCSSYNLLDTLNFDNFTNLEAIECLQSYTVTKVSMKNTPKLRRLCLEDNNLSEYDISESTALEDIRGAMNNYSEVKFSNSTEEFWHICVRDNPQVTNDSLFAHLDRFPNIAELYIWNMNQGGTFRMAHNHPTMNIQLWCDGNHFSALDMRGSLQNENGYADVSFALSPIRSIELEGCDQIKRLALGWCGMPTALVDKILRQMDEFGTSNGTIYLVGSEMPSATGLAHRASLESRGWTVEVSGPRIQVRGNDAEISNNDDTPASTDNTDFGTGNIGEEVIHSFSIVNQGTHELHLSGTPRIAVGGLNPTDFRVATIPATTIYPWGGSTTFAIAFSPRAPGLRQATISIANNGFDYKNPYTFTIQGEGDTQISDTTLSLGTISCFGSETILTIAGDDSEVRIEDGASVNFIATQSIHFLPGFHADLGSVVHAWITTDGTFCDEAPAPASNYKSAAGIVYIKEVDKSCYERRIKLFPNPNRGIFTLQVENIEFPVEVSIVNSLGTVVYTTRISGGTTTLFNLPQLDKGFYFVIVNNDKARLTKKMVVE